MFYMSMFYDQDEYELTTNTDYSDLLAELPFDLIKEAILEQINDPISSRTNYIEIILDKVEVFKEQFQDTDDIILELNEQLQLFFLSIINAIDEKYNLAIDIDNISKTKNIVEIGESIYRYFVVRYVKNITKFITKYIYKYKKNFCKYYEDKNKKDVSTLAFKKQIKNSDDLCIITNLPSIIKEIVSMDISSDEFVSLSANEGYYDAVVVKNLISSMVLVGDFYRPYINMCLDSYDYIIDELQTDIRIKLINKIMK